MDTLLMVGVVVMSSPHLGRPNIYHWPLVKTVEELCKEQSILASQKVISPTQASLVVKRIFISDICNQISFIGI